MKKHAPRDADGKDLRIGDWVRVVMVPLSIKDMPDESRSAFSRAVGHTFQIEAFDEIGCLELFMWPKISMDTIWIEPYCVKRVRRYKRLSRSFQKRLEQDAAPRYEVRFDVRLKEGVDIEAFGDALFTLVAGGGFATWPRERRIKGSIHADKAEPDAIDILNEARRFIAASEHVEWHDVSEIADADES